VQLRGIPMHHKTSRSLSVLAMLLIASVAPTASAEQLAVDFGQVRPGTVDTFEIDARNESCDQPQDFKFLPRDLPWLKLTHGNSVRDIARGKSKKFVTTIDLAGLGPGRHSGRIDVLCETCGREPKLTSCRIDTHSIALTVEVVARTSANDRPQGASIRALAQ